MAFQKFEDIIAWQKSQDLAVEIYRHFGQLNDFGFRNQITRAAVSISNNIAEGFDERTDAQFVRYLGHSRGSSAEVRSMLYLAKRLGFIDEASQRKLISQSREASRLVQGLMRSIEANPRK